MQGCSLIQEAPTRSAPRCLLRKRRPEEVLQGYPRPRDGEEALSYEMLQERGTCELRQSFSLSIVMGAPHSDDLQGGEPFFVRSLSGKAGLYRTSRTALSSIGRVCYPIGQVGQVGQVGRIGQVGRQLSLPGRCGDTRSALPGSPPRPPLRLSLPGSPSPSGVVALGLRCPTRPTRPTRPIIQR